MTNIKLFKRGEGHVKFDNGNYLMVSACELDGDGQWIPNRTQAFESINQLKKYLREIIGSGDGVDIQASSKFKKLMKTLGLKHKSSEWGNFEDRPSFSFFDHYILVDLVRSV